jgi:hypothetical protein
MSGNLPAMTLYKDDGSEVKLSFDSGQRAKSAGASSSSSSSSKRSASPPAPKVLEREYSKETLADAYKIYDSNELLEERLKSEDFYEAAMYCGVLLEKLPKRDTEFFRQLPDRARKLDDYHTSLREEECVSPCRQRPAG